MSGYIGNTPVPQSTQTRDNFTATSGQTTFNTAGYTPGYVDVYLNGLHLDPSDYTATNGSDIVLATGATAGDVVTVLAFSTYQVARENITPEGLFEHANTITSDYATTSGNNAISGGPITINSGVTVTVASNSTWTIA